MTQEEYRRQEAELDDLYRDIIIDHYRHPRHKGHLDAPSATHEGLNPLCGDEVTVEVKVDGDRVADIAYTGSGCSISQSSASMMTEAVDGKSLEETRRLIGDFTSMMRGRKTSTRRRWVTWKRSPACASSRCASSARRWPGTRWTRR